MAKRGQNEGSITRRKDGRYMARVTMPDGTRPAVYGRTRAEVSAKLTEALKRKQDGLPVATPRQSVEQFLTTLLGATKPTLKQGTWQRYEQYVRVHAMPEIGRVQLAKLNGTHLQSLYARRLAVGASPRTVGHLHRVVHRAFGQAVRWDLLVRNPVEQVDPPRVNRIPMQVLSADQARTLLDAASSERIEALYVLALTTGMRQGELLALKWRHVDFDAGMVQVEGSLLRTKDGFSIGETKSAKTRRIALTSQAIEALRRHRSVQNQERLHLGAHWEDQDLVFANEVGRPIEAGNFLRRSFWPLLARAGCPRIRFHDLRHTAATLMLERGVPIKMVSEMLGHASVGITLDVYAHVTPAMQQQAVNTMEAIFAR